MAEFRKWNFAAGIVALLAALTLPASASPLPLKTGPMLCTMIAPVADTTNIAANNTSNTAAITVNTAANTFADTAALTTKTKLTPDNTFANGVTLNPNGKTALAAVAEIEENAATMLQITSGPNRNTPADSKYRIQTAGVKLLRT